MSDTRWILGAIVLWAMAAVRLVFVVYIRCVTQSESTVEPIFRRIFLYLVIAAAVASCAFHSEDFLDWAQFKWPMGIAWTGFAIGMLSVLLMIWVHAHLGKNWAGVVTEKVNHTLSTTGPYQLARHPMYSCFFLFALGVLLATNNVLVGGLFGLTCLVAATRIAMEERLMVKLFGQAYLDYKQQVGAFWPWPWLDCGPSLAELKLTAPLVEEANLGEDKGDMEEEETKEISP